MKVILFAIGTRGDVEPFLAIAQLLREKGCEVICVFPEQYRMLVEKFDIPFRGFSKDIIDLLNSTEAKTIYGNQGSIYSRIKLLIGMAKISLRISKDSLVLQHFIQINEKPDMILYHPKCSYSVLWGMSNYGKSILVNPTIDPLTDLGFYHGEIINKFKIWMIYTIRALMLKFVSKFFKKEYRGVKISVSSIRSVMLKKEKTFYTISSMLLRKPLNCPFNTSIVGYYESNTIPDWKPDEKLVQFIKENDKIIFITFGSMTNKNPKEKTQSIVNVLKKHNISAIINTSWGGLEEIDEQADNIYFIKNVPYDWLFPKIYAVVHHGGSGTTHTALKYGCPCLIIPHVLDQFFWEKSVSKLKLGPKGISIRKFNEKEFEIKVLDLYNSNIYKQNALVISERMKEESNKDKLYDLIMR